VFVVVVLDCGVGVYLAGKPLPLVFQEGCCVVFCLYSPSTSKMSGVGTLLYIIYYILYIYIKTGAN